MTNYDVARQDLQQKMLNRYGADGVKALLEATFTADQLRALDSDRYQFLLQHRSKEVEAVLNATQDAAIQTAKSRKEEIIIHYTAMRQGRVSAQEFNDWFQSNFAEHVARFTRDYPQVEFATSDANQKLIYQNIVSRNVLPEYSELVASFNQLAIPASGYPMLALKLPDGGVATGRELREAIKKWPMELLEPVAKQLSREQMQSADEFLANHPELRDDRPPQLLLERFHKEFARFLKSDVGRAWHKRMSQYGHDNTARMADYMEQHGLELTQKGFEIAAVAICDEISITLDQNDIGGARVSNTFIHDAGGSHHVQLPMGATMAGQSVPSIYNPDKVWTEAEVRRELRRLSADQLRERLADKAFVAALDEYKLR
jgi:hypothetical protein